MARSSFIPGFRFHPTDSELVMYYLKRKVLGKKIIVDVVTELNIYEYSPWDLRDKSALKTGDLEWFFFCPKSKKYNSGSRYNRATEIGFWKATGKDRNVTYRGRTVATIKTLVFHIGHAGKGERTDWVMHEYRLEDEQLANAGVVQDTYVLIKLFEKAGSGPKNGAQYGAPFNEEEWEDDDIASCSNTLATVGPLEATTTNPLGYKQNGPATINMYEPGSSAVTCSANETTGNTNPLGYKQKGPATVNMYELGSSAVTCSANETTGKIAQYKQKSTTPTEMMIAPQNTHNVCLTEPESSIVTLSANERCGDVPVGDHDMMSLEDIAFLLGVSEDFTSNNTNEVVEVIMAPNADDGIYNELVNLINLDEFNGGASASGSKPAVYMFDKPLDDLDFNLGAFYVD